ncbi:MAG TPA: PilZ domain-containing protein [Kofleriaceae bacterium]|nr:PilZ domain-containing protein [Kofleriaceae bacterium]
MHSSSSGSATQSADLFVVLEPFRTGFADFVRALEPLTSGGNEGPVLGSSDVYYRADTDIALLSLRFDRDAVTPQKLAWLTAVAARADLPVLDPARLGFSDRRAFYEDYLPHYRVRVESRGGPQEALEELARLLALPDAPPMRSLSTPSARVATGTVEESPISAPSRPSLDEPNGRYGAARTVGRGPGARASSRRISSDAPVASDKLAAVSPPSAVAAPASAEPIDTATTRPKTLPYEALSRGARARRRQGPALTTPQSPRVMTPEEVAAGADNGRARARSIGGVTAARARVRGESLSGERAGGETLPPPSGGPSRRDLRTRGGSLGPSQTTPPAGALAPTEPAARSARSAPTGEQAVAAPRAPAGAVRAEPSLDRRGELAGIAPPRGTPPSRARLVPARPATSPPASSFARSSSPSTSSAASSSGSFPSAAGTVAPPDPGSYPPPAREDAIGRGKRPAVVVEDEESAPPLKVRFLRGDQWTPGRLRALSLQGARLAAAAPPRPGDIVQLTIGLDHLDVVVSGEVTSVTTAAEAALTGEPSGFSVHFSELEPQARTRLVSVLKRAKQGGISLRPPPPRASVRFPVRWPTGVITSWGEFNTAALDVSRSGLFLAATGTALAAREIVFHLPMDTTGRALAGRAQIAREVSEEMAARRGLSRGYGVRILDFSRNDAQRYDSFLDRVRLRTEKRVLIAARRERGTELGRGLIAAGYAVHSGNDLSGLTDSVDSGPAPDAALIDAGLLASDPNAGVLKRALQTRQVPVLTIGSEQAERARAVLDQLLHIT